MAFSEVHVKALFAGLLLLWHVDEAQLSSAFTIDQVNLTLVPGPAVETGTNVRLLCHVQVSHSSEQRLVHSFSFLLNQGQVIYAKNSSDSQVEYSLTPARAANSGRYTCHVQVLEKERSSQEQRLTVSGLMTPVLTVTPHVIFEGQEVKVSCLSPNEAGSLIFHLYVNGNLIRTETKSPPGVEEVKVKLTKPGETQIHCKMNILGNYEAGVSNISNVERVTVRELEVTPTISFDPPSDVVEGDFLRVDCAVPKFNDIPRDARSKLELFLTKDGRVLKQEGGKEKCGLTLRTKSGDSGTYVCKAEIDNLQKTVSGRALVAELFSVPEVRVTPSVVFEGDNFTVFCSVPHVADQRVNQSVISYRLFRNQRELQRGQHYMATAGSAHDGGYFCLAEAKGIGKNSTETIVKAKMLPSTLSISVEGAVILGRPFQVSCRTDRGSLPITFTLMRGQRLAEQKQVYALSALFNASAIGRKTELLEFSCHAHNDATRPRVISMPLSAPVIEPVSRAMLTLEPFGGGVTEGSDLKLTCSVPQGSPPLTFTFYHSPQGAPASRQQQQLTQTRVPGTNRASYTVRAIARHQAGQYQCHVANVANNKSSSVIHVHVKLAAWKVALMTVCVILLVAAIGVLLLILIKRGSCSCSRTKKAGQLSVKPAKTRSNDPQRVSLVLEEQPAPNATPGMLGRSVWSERMSGSDSDSQSGEEDHSVEGQHSQVPQPPHSDMPTPTPPETGECTALMTNGTDTEYSQVQTTNTDIPTQTEGASLEYAQLNHSDPEPQ
ncbi:platelet endothelial cell adhesion molecule isoform X1 [Alosa pseudoharengus]|uniref:platelet endothelial cell adhesion molecule isoform X1 n=1 Tax=Alosa pseudoharengus TaxID=34774 RepID=UPI003F89A3A8